uniref:Uncharacterized protein n=1 Tax=Anopheles coluzzii TaxID=1518534 RepID=A0A8W7PFT6_ANOCL
MSVRRRLKIQAAVGPAMRTTVSKVATHRVAQDVHPLQPHRHPPGFDRGDKLSLSSDRILVVLRVGTTAEPQYVDRVHRPVVGNRVEIEHPQPHTCPESVQQQDGNVFRLPVQCHRAYLIVRPDTLTHFNEDTFKGFPKGCKRRSNKSHLRKTKSKVEPAAETVAKIKESTVWQMENELYEFARDQFHFVQKKLRTPGRNVMQDFMYEKIKPNPNGAAKN